MFVIIIGFSYIYMSQSRVEMHLGCGGIYNNHIIANCLQSVPTQKFWKSVNNWQRYGQKQSDTFLLAHSVHSLQKNANICDKKCLVACA